MMNRTRIVCVLFSLIASVVGCSTPAKLIGDSWEVSSVAGEPVVASNEMRHLPMFRFLPDSGKVLGFSGCNQFSGTYVQNGDSLRFGPLVMTKMACPFLELENKIVGAITATRTVERDGDLVSFMAGDTVLMVCRSKVYPDFKQP